MCDKRGVCPFVPAAVRGGGQSDVNNDARTVVPGAIDGGWFGAGDRARVPRARDRAASAEEPGADPRGARPAARGCGPLPGRRVDRDVYRAGIRDANAREFAVDPMPRDAAPR